MAADMNRPDLPRRLRAQLALSALNWKFGPEGWRIFPTSTGRLQATRGSSCAWVKGPGAQWALRPGWRAPDACDADTPAQLAAKLTARSQT